MKKKLFVFLTVMMVLFFNQCSSKKARLETDMQQGTRVEKVDEKIPVVQKSKQTEEALSKQRSSDQPGEEGILKRIHFDFDKYYIREDMKSVLQANADWLTKHKSAQLLIEGHCDERGTEEYNIGLGEKRAHSARDFLISQGVARASIKTISYGKSRPLVKGVDEATWFQNRRCEFVITNK